MKTNELDCMTAEAEQVIEVHLESYSGIRVLYYLADLGVLDLEETQEAILEKQK